MAKPADQPPFRADHVGSLLRPPELSEARAKWEAGTLSPEDLKTVEDKCILDAITLQEGVGLKGITDGDFRRNDWFLDFMYSFEGIEKGGAGMYVPFSGGLDYYAPKTVFTGKVKCPEGGVMVDAFKFLKANVHETAKICIPAPAMFNTVMSESLIGESPYDTIDEFWADIGQAYADAVKHLVAAGCTYLQIDDVNSANLGDPKWQAVWQQQGRSPLDVCNNTIRLNNAALDARPAGVTAAVHMCRGNYQSEYAAAGGYDVIAETYFNSMHVDAFFMEYDDARSGSFEPLRFMPKDKVVVLGLITSKRPDLEDKDMIKRRIDEASKYVDLDRLCLSPQCGFASTKEGNRLTQDDQKRKLEHVVEIATEVWGGV